MAVVDFMCNILIVPPNDLFRHPLPNRLYHIAKRLSTHHEISVFSYVDHPLAMGSKQRDLNCTEIIFRSLRVQELGLYYLLNMPAMLRPLNKAVKEANLIIHANIIPSYLALKLAKRSRVPAVYDYMDYYPQSASYYFNNDLLKCFSFNLVSTVVKENLKMSQKVVTVSYALKKIISTTINENKVAIIPNGVDDDLFIPLSKEKARKLLALDNNAIILLFYGSVDFWFDFDQILNLLKTLLNLNLNVLLIIIGASHNPNARKDLLSKVKQAGLTGFFKMLGPVPYEDVPLFINASDVVIAPFKKEPKNSGPPQKIIETLACAVPIAIPFIPEFISWFGSAPIYYTNFDELKKKIVEVVRNGYKIRRELLPVSIKIRKKFSWNTIANAYERIIAELLDI